MLASGDPLNFILACIWSGVLVFCLYLTWYAYVIWKRNPDGSLSQMIASRLQGAGVAGLIAIGIGIGLTLGMFLGHWAWPVEIAR